MLLAGYHCFAVLFLTPPNMGTFPRLTWLTLEFYSPGQKSGDSLGSPIRAVIVSYNDPLYSQSSGHQRLPDVNSSSSCLWPPIPLPQACQADPSA